MNQTVQIALAFTFGISFFAILISLAVRFPNPTSFQYSVFRSVLSLAAGVGAVIPGLLDVGINPSAAIMLRAGGALGVFVVVYFWNPARQLTESGLVGTGLKTPEATAPEATAPEATAPGATAPVATPVAELRIESLRRVDDNGIRSATERFGRKWPPCRIIWPESLGALTNDLRKCLDLIDNKSVQSEPGASFFVSNVRDALKRAETMCNRVPDLIPGMVARLSRVSDDELTLAIGNYLLLVNFHAHSLCAYYASWEGMKRRGFNLPEELRDLALDAGKITLASILGSSHPENGLVSGRLRLLDGAEIFFNSSPGIIVWAPLEDMQRAECGQHSGDAICRWFIPQLECDDASSLPQEYLLEKVYVDKIFGGASKSSPLDFDW